MMADRVALVCAALNEGQTIGLLIESLLNQRRRPDEIIIVDGGSTDDTVITLTAWIERGAPIRLLELPGSSISQARNAGIRATDAPVLAITDCGVTLEPDWLELLVSPFVGANPPDVVGGFFLPAGQGSFEVALGATTLVGVADVDPGRFLPSSRSVAFRREAWAAAGGYPEWLEHSEDVVFDLRLKELGCRFHFEPRAIVHFRPRSTLRGFMRQYFNYARGDGKANLWPKRHAIRYVTYALAPVLLSLGRRWPRLWAVIAVLGCLYMRRPYERLPAQMRGLSPAQKLGALLWVPVVRLTGDLAKMLGYPAGAWWRLRHV